MKITAKKLRGLEVGSPGYLKEAEIEILDINCRIELSDQI